MKKLMMGLVILLATATFVTGTLAQGQIVAPQSPDAEKANAEKHKASKPMKVYGTVVAYEAGKTIAVKGRKGKEWMFAIAPDAKIKGEVKEGGKVRVGYKKEDDKMFATYISVATPRKAKPSTKEGDTK